MKHLAALPLLLALTPALAAAPPFRLECTDISDAKKRLALIEISVEAATILIYSESTHDWRSAVNVSIAESTFSYVEHAFNDAGSATSVTINRVTGQYFAYRGNSPRKDGQCKKVLSELR